MSIEDDLKPTAADHIHSVVCAMTSFVPGGSEGFNWLVDKPINIRRDHWIVEMEKRLRYLESHGLSIDELQNNEEFISAVLYASSIAIRNHSEEKRRALLNAITNIAIHENLDESKNRMFLNYIDTFTDWHLRILFFYDCPFDRFIQANKQIQVFTQMPHSMLFFNYFSKNDINEAFAEAIINDLHNKNFLEIAQNQFSQMVSYRDIRDTFISPLGKEFIQFIKNME